jgi:hypothetical protein
MPRHISITLVQRDVRCVARLLDEEAPRTAEAVWQALPLEGDAYHAKYARNEVYTFVPPFADAEPGLEHPTITPIPGDVVYFNFSATQLHAGTYGYGEDEATAGHDRAIDLAIFYGRNNLLLNADVGWVPGNVFATIIEGLEEMAAACNDVWRAGAIGERLRFERVEDRP